MLRSGSTAALLGLLLASATAHAQPMPAPTMAPPATSPAPPGAPSPTPMPVVPGAPQLTPQPVPATGPSTTGPAPAPPAGAWSAQPQPVAPPVAPSGGPPPSTWSPGAPQPAPWQPAPPWTPGYGAPAPVGLAYARPEPATRAQTLGRVLRTVDDEAEDYHVAALVLGLGLGAVLIPTGTVVLADKETDAQGAAGGMLLGAGIGAALGGALQLVAPFGATAELGDEYEERLARGEPVGSVVADTEAKWAEAAEGERMGRKITGVIAMAVGGVGLGASVLLAADAIGDVKREDRHVLSGVFGVSGAFLGIAGIQAFLWETPVEAAWGTYAASQGLPRRPTQPLSFLPRVDVVAGPGIGLVTLDGRF